MRAEPPSSSTADGGVVWSDLPWELLDDIHGRLSFTDRLAFTAVFGRQIFKPETPWLVLPQISTYLYKTTFFSLVDRRSTTVRARPLRDNILLGSSGGWLAMADNEGNMHLVNPVTGEQHDLPAITTNMVGLNIMSFSEMRDSVYRKVVLSASARPSSYAAMLIMGSEGYNVLAFATAKEPSWKLAPPRDNVVVDAVHHRGRFYSLSRSGDLEVWDEKELTSEVVTSSGLAGEGNKQLATTPDGRLILVFQDALPFSIPRLSYYTFRVQVLDEASGSWQETDDIGQAAVLVGAENNIMCVSTRELRLGYGQNLRSNCVYFIDDVQLGVQLGVYSLRHHTVKHIEELGLAERWGAMWKAAAWFTPSFP